jgi:hypothetical protein
MHCLEFRVDQGALSLRRAASLLTNRHDLNRLDVIAGE